MATENNNPLIVMTAITGKPTAEMILAYLTEMKEHGVGGILLYPRSGCELAYMSEEWFATVSAFLEGAKALDLTVWLYDEFNWPSGDAAGKVSANPAFRLKAIKTRGKEAGTVLTSSRHNANVFGEKRFPDLMNADAVDYFISLTHEPYYQRFAPYFGNVIAGIFTDEPSMSYCCRTEGCFPTDEGLMPYYNGMEVDYEARTARDFYADMRAGDASFYEVSLSLVSERFRVCYLDKLAVWCRDHGVLLTGHLFEDDAPVCATKANGDFLKNLSAIPLPGVDDIYTNLQAPRMLSLLGSAQYARGENGAMIELYALGPCDISYAKRLCALYFAAAFGIDRYFLAISPLDARGNSRIPDFFSCFRADQPDFGGMPQFAERAKEAARYAATEFSPDLYVRYPFSLCARHHDEPFPLDGFFSDTLATLSRHQLQWKFLAEGEEAAAGIPVLSVTDALTLTLDGTPLDTAEAIVHHFSRPLFVTDEEGNAPRGIFLRRYANGEHLLLNLCDKEARLVAEGKSFTLPPYGVLCSGEEQIEGTRLPLSPDFKLSYQNDNLIRLMYLNGEKNAEIRSEEDIPLSFSVRAGVEAILDGATVALKDGDYNLPPIFSPFYQSTPTVLLKKGGHTVTAGADLKYLPSVILAGNFTAEPQSGAVCRVCLTARKTDYTVGEMLYDYGNLTFTATVRVPHGARFLELGGTTLMTELSLDGASLGTCLAAPYRYPVPPALYGKEISLAICQASSLGPIFGDTAYYDREEKDAVSWRGTPSTKQASFGFSSLNWIL